MTASDNKFEFGSIPDELRQLPQWVTWRLESRNGSDKPTKIPYDPKHSDRKASVTDCETWGTFDEAVAAAARHGHDGVGFVFTEADPYVGIDFDNCFAGGKVTPKIRAFIDEVDSYTEVSQSGEGTHILARADNLPSGKNVGWCEMYSKGRYFVTTGRHVEGTPETVEYREEAVRALYAKITEAQTPEMPEAAAKKPGPSTKPELMLPGSSVTVSESSHSLFRAIADHPAREIFLRAEAVATLSAAGTLETVSPERLVTIAERYVDIKRWNVFHQNGKTAPVKVGSRMPVSTAKLFLASDERRELSPVSILTRAPVITETDGGLGLVESYSSELGGILVTGNIRPMLTGDIHSAAETIRQILRDFDFLTPGDESRAVAAIITAALKMGGFFGEESVPITYIEADQSQAGKTLLAKIIAALFGELPRFVTIQDAGVGSFDESIGRAMVDGLPFILIDNVRGQIRSQRFESLLTAGKFFTVRIPYSPELNVDPGRFFFMLTSNGAEMTRDLSNRMNPVQIRKRAEGYAYTSYPEGNIVAHIKADPAPYLGAVFDAVADWFDHGKPSKDDGIHDFRAWAGALNWIVQRLGFAPLSLGLDVAKAKASTPTLVMLRAVAFTLDSQGRTGEDLIASQIVEVAEEIGAADCLKGDTTQQRAKTLGIRLGGIFKNHDSVEVDEFTISRSIRHNAQKGAGGAFESKTYTFAKN